MIYHWWQTVDITIWVAGGNEWSLLGHSMQSKIRALYKETIYNLEQKAYNTDELFIQLCSSAFSSSLLNDSLGSSFMITFRYILSSLWTIRAWFCIRSYHCITRNWCPSYPWSIVGGDESILNKLYQTPTSISRWVSHSSDLATRRFDHSDDLAAPVAQWLGGFTGSATRPLSYSGGSATQPLERLDDSATRRLGHLGDLITRATRSLRRLGHSSNSTTQLVRQLS